MIYRILYSDQATTDIRESMEWWRDNRSVEQARRWIAEIFPAIETLQRDPERFPLASETDLHPYGLRQLFFGVGRSVTHRVVFTVQEDAV